MPSELIERTIPLPELSRSSGMQDGQGRKDPDSNGPAWLTPESARASLLLPPDHIDHRAFGVGRTSASQIEVGWGKGYRST